jgi:hypothetical protein
MIKIRLKESLEKSAAKFVLPSLEDEKGEIDRYNFSKDEIKRIKKQFVQKNLQPLSDSVWKKLQNTDSWSIKNLEDVIKLSQEYGRDWESIKNALESNKELPAPIVLRRGGSYELIGGNTRLMVAKALNIRPTILLIEL